MSPIRLSVLVLMTAGSLVGVRLPSAMGQWKMHVIDNSSRGADGVRLADFNGDRKVDIVTGWEEGGIVRVYQNPGAEKVHSKWPAVTVGKVKSPEDAVFVDLDANGILDVVSCCEGKTKTVFVHWAPQKPGKYLDEKSWVTRSFPASIGKCSWMFATPADIDGVNGLDLFVGSKGKNAFVGWLQSPENPRRLENWKLHRIENAGWVMSLRALHWQQRPSLLVSDRKGKRRGVYLLRQDKPQVPVWERIDISLASLEFMFLDFQISAGSLETVVATRNGKFIHYILDSNGSLTDKTEIANPDRIPTGKAVAIGDIDRDGVMDFVHSSNIQSVKRSKEVHGVHWLTKKNGTYAEYPISGTQGKKFDRLELVDLDGDGDLDVLTCEEVDNLGVIWFENPTR